MTDYARREILVCTDEPWDLSKLDASVPHVLCMSEPDIKYYNEQCADFENAKWKFEVGHPRNGFTYIQHPLEKNTYYTLETFHASMLERKHSELMRLLQALGATRVTASVTHSDGRTEDRREQAEIGGEYNNEVMRVSGKSNFSGTSAGTENLYHHLAESVVFNESNEEPYIPDDLCFYQHEEKWQQIAQDALKKRRRECEVTLEYRHDYSINTQRMEKVDAQLQVFVHSANMNYGDEFESNLRRQTSTVWHYKVEFGSPETKVVNAKVSTAKSAVAKTAMDKSKGEQLFLKRAKRYIQNDGKIDAEERADLEQLAKKFGIDDFRFEELIEEAFDEG